MVLRIALIQLAVGLKKAENLQRAAKLVSSAATAGAKLVALPECCNSPYGNNYFPEYAEEIPGESTNLFAKIARDNAIYLLAGSIPERDGNKLYNTCTIYNPEGDMIGKFRKIHLFDIDVPGKMTFKESKTITPGEELYSFDVKTSTDVVKVGVGICYDIRFPELATCYRKAGCHLLIYPGAFNLTTGPLHWQLLNRARAVDNQMYVASVSPARDETASYKAWGHSLVVSPWAEVLEEADHSEDIIYATIDVDQLQQVRQQIPIQTQGRPEVYKCGVSHQTQ